MKFNKKGNSLTEPFNIVIIIVIVAIFSFSFLRFGINLISSDYSNLNSQSRTYISSQAGIDINNIDSSDITNPFYVAQNETGEGNPKDDALEFQYYREQSGELRNLVQDLYSLPSFTISWFGLDLSEWEIIKNIFDTVINLIIMFLIYKFIRGIIR